jgi:hypothetical protein
MPDPDRDRDLGSYRAFDIARFELPVDEEFAQSPPGLQGRCDWCGEPCASEYFVVARGKHYALCPTCWGRSPAYQELRHKGMAHETTLRMLGIAAAEEW